MHFAKTGKLIGLHRSTDPESVQVSKIQRLLPKYFVVFAKNGDN